jgi:hypothetical protein
MSNMNPVREKMARKPLSLRERGRGEGIGDWGKSGAL